MKCYGFSPLRMPADLKFKDLVHGHDERVPIDGIAFGLRALFDALYRLVM
jgi:acetylornithine deacetylase/succinyl-diaminopimelate desuccinylase-like protein